MINYTNDKELINTTLGKITKSPELFSLYISAETFMGKENRFFKIISKDTIDRSIKYPTLESMAKESKRRFREITNVYDSIE